MIPNIFEFQEQVELIDGERSQNGGGRTVLTGSSLRKQTF